MSAIKIETVEHYVLHCKEHRKGLSQMMDEIQRYRGFGCETERVQKQRECKNRESECLNVSIDILLGPKFSEKLTKKKMMLSKMPFLSS